ncbi:alpha/beta fold hydrolase [Pseudoduganella sp. FT25W]|uniref:Alpha/beta fold hydrolase n=1 Tax=Duganella alba TaxID=2666081 RepID=A0A6L5Q9T1_9BURK|nr:alpha/beta hydrolase [Duganella alba]MRX06416.1 alpha/beta fold hydrolase [Duganella alba]MRX14810.1 alpha/beta fold hydrolase [Duganella alba]
MASVQANGITIAYETSGDPLDPPVLLIMGLGMQLIAWPKDLVDGLVEQGYYVIRFDNRDIGLSTKMRQHKKPSLVWVYLKSLLGLKQSAPYTLYDMADDAVALLDALGLARAHLVGVSMGGMIAQIMAARFPDRTLSLTSIMSTSGRRGLPGPTASARNAMMRSSDPSDRKATVDRVVNVYKVIGSPSFPTPERVMRANIERAIDRGANPDGVARQMVAIVAAGDRTALLRKIRCPAMVIHGAADPLLPVACGVDTAEAILGARLHIIEGMGHDLPQQLNERLLALLDQHLRGNMAAELPPLAPHRAGSGTHH